MPIDAMFLEHQRPYLTLAHSERAGLGNWHYLAAYHLASEHPDHGPKHEVFALLAYDGQATEDMVVFPALVNDWRVSLSRDLRINEPVVVYDWQSGEASVRTLSFAIEPIAELYGHRYYLIAPIFSNGLALLGETDKLVPLADARFAAIEPGAGEIAVAIEGAPGEVVTLSAYDADAGQMLAPLSLTVGADGRASGALSR